MWPRISLRVLALVNVVFVLVGSFDTQTALSAFPILHRSIASSSVSSDFPYQAQIFYVMTAVNYIWRLRPLGRILSNVVFGAEIGYWLSRYAIKFALLELGGDRPTSQKQHRRSERAREFRSLRTVRHLVSPNRPQSF
jgi:hypothetical protein